MLALATNAVLVGLGLWAVLALSINRVLSRPLVALTQAVTSLNMAADPSKYQNIHYPDKNELGVLVAALNSLWLRLLEAKESLEATVHSRTLELQATSQQLVLRAGQLERSAEQLRRILEDSPIAVRILTLDKKFVFANKRFYDLFNGGSTSSRAPTWSTSTKTKRTTSTWPAGSKPRAPPGRRACWSSSNPMVRPFGP